MPRYQEHEILSAGDLDIVGAQFGIRIIPREKGQSDLIEVYTEDDGNYFLKNSFAAYWLADMVKVCQEAIEKADTEVIFK